MAFTFFDVHRGEEASRLLWLLNSALNVFVSDLRSWSESQVSKLL